MGWHLHIGEPDQIFLGSIRKIPSLRLKYSSIGDGMKCLFNSRGNSNRENIDSYGNTRNIGSVGSISEYEDIPEDCLS